MDSDTSSNSATRDRKFSSSDLNKSFINQINFEPLLEMEDNLYGLVGNKKLSHLGYNCSSYVNTL